MKKYYFYFLVLLFNISFTNELNSSSIKKWRQPFTHNDEIVGINPYSPSHSPVGNNSIKNNSNMLQRGSTIPQISSDQHIRHVKNYSNNNTVFNSIITEGVSFQKSNNTLNRSVDILRDGVSPQLAIHNNGDLYCLLSVDVTGTDDIPDGGLDLNIYKSTDEGETWESQGYVFAHSGTDLVDGDIEVLDEHILFLYNKDGIMKTFWLKMDFSDYGETELGVPSNWSSYGLWGSITSDKFYYDIDYVWTYAVWGAHKESTDESRIYYSYSSDNGKNWSTPVVITNEYVSYFRPGLAITYSTPIPTTSQDYVWTTWCDEYGNIRIAKLDVWTENVEKQTVMTSYDDNWDFFSAPVINSYYDQIVVMGGVTWDEDEYGWGTDMDIAGTFSNDGGNSWGYEYSWYYWEDSDTYPDSWDMLPSPTYSPSGAIGFTMIKGLSDGTDDVIYKVNFSGNLIDNWSEDYVVKQNVSVNMTGSAMLKNKYNIVFDDNISGNIYHENYDINDIYTPSSYCSSEACVSIQNVNLNSNTLEIHMINNVPIWGFQIGLNGMNISTLFGGNAFSYNYFNFDNYYSSNAILGYQSDSSGELIPAGQGILFKINFTNYNNGEICFDNSVFDSGNMLADEYGEDVNTSWGDCYSSSIVGCTYTNACNYNSTATEDDGSCVFANEGFDCDGNPLSVPGCIYETACNYDSTANEDDGSCVFATEGLDCDGNELSVNDLLIPLKFNINSIYPNPFNPITNISLSVSQYGQVTVKVYNLNGKIIATIQDENMNPGYYNIKWDASNYPSGIYLIQMMSEEFIKTQKVVLMK